MKLLATIAHPCIAHPFKSKALNGGITVIKLIGFLRVAFSLMVMTDIEIAK